MTPGGAAGEIHVPVMKERIETLLAPVLDAPGAVMVDATLGLAGHSLVLLERFPDMRLIGIDRDQRALDLAQERLAHFTSRVTLVHAVYDQLAHVLNELGLANVTGILMDLGVSSLQLDEKQRGFAYGFDAPLDMRMDSNLDSSAAEVLNTYSAAELARILRSYGEERFARRIANAVVTERASEPFVNSGRLVDVIRRALPAATMRTGGHPAKRTFQALRIEVNNELGSLEQALPTAVEALAVRGRMVVLSYHSLEDRLVKRCLAAFTKDDVPSDFPVPGRGPELRLLTRGCERPDSSETEHNPRAASARLRAAERVRVAA